MGTASALAKTMIIILVCLIQKIAKYQWMLTQPSENLDITTSYRSLPTAARLAAAAPVAYYVDKSSVSGDVNQVHAIERKSYLSSWPTGYGSDSGGGDTVMLLKKIYERFGVATSFTGTYKADEWSLNLTSQSHNKKTKSPCQEVVENSSKTIEILSEEVKSQKKQITALKEKRDESFSQQISSSEPIYRSNKSLASIIVLTVMIAHLVL